MFENMKARYNAVRFAQGLTPTENEALGRGTTTQAVIQLERYVVWLMNNNVFGKMSPDEQDAASAKRDAQNGAIAGRTRTI